MASGTPVAAFGANGASDAGADAIGQKAGKSGGGGFATRGKSGGGGFGFATGSGDAGANGASDAGADASGQPNIGGGGFGTLGRPTESKDGCDSNISMSIQAPSGRLQCQGYPPRGKGILQHDH